MRQFGEQLDKTRLNNVTPGCLCVQTHTPHTCLQHIFVSE
jgi:hypothetical protein